MPTKAAAPTARDVQAFLGDWLRQAPAPEIRQILDPPDEWAVSLPIAHLLVGLVRHFQLKSLLEFGAGRSSLVLASALPAGGRLTSVEHQPAFAEAAWRKLSQFPGVEAQLIATDLAPRWSRHGMLHEYVDVSARLRSRAPFDLVFVDAPPGHLGRDATVLRAAPFLQAGALIVVDDAARMQEQTAVRRWMRALPLESVFESDSVGRGVVVLRQRQAATPGFSLRTFAGTVHDRIQGRSLRTRP